MAKGELQFMGAPVTDEGDGKFKVAKSDADKILSDLGVTKEVRKVLTAADNKLAEAAVEFTGTQVIKTKAPVTLELGSGASKLTFGMQPVATGRNPKTGEETTSYGRFSFRKRGAVPSAIKDGCLADMQKKIEAAFK